MFTKKCLDTPESPAEATGQFEPGRGYDTLARDCWRDSDGSMRVIKATSLFVLVKENKNVSRTRCTQTDH